MWVSVLHQLQPTPTYVCAHAVLNGGVWAALCVRTTTSLEVTERLLADALWMGFLVMQAQQPVCFPASSFRGLCFAASSCCCRDGLSCPSVACFPAPVSTVLHCFPLHSYYHGRRIGWLMLLCGSLRMIRTCCGTRLRCQPLLCRDTPAQQSVRHTTR